MAATGGSRVQGFYGFADGGGGVALIEAESAAALARTTAPWTPWLRFTTNPIVPIEESSAIDGEAVASATPLAEMWARVARFEDDPVGSRLHPDLGGTA
jgi:Protein of unknown function (DUF3303)